ncbi:retinoid-inducible serine carboxypeptidase-like [Polistes fuscatus]|uniref:retinoid-inducible serine carboxypeptidase-like n=1 Tax=Polistes fuscatus TaxID=30207 RepID=UPI001CA92A13|nr:retinoid-inducible serine carboxypeptidase-like [Polistes fuscatus]
MQRVTLSVIILSCLLYESVGKVGFGPGEQDWGHVTVRQYAHMFWWLYYTTANVQSYYEKPLVIWLQGGPGGSSTSYGNFEELGPLDMNLKPRNHTWVKDYNVLFIDNPVGTGFSYVEKSEAYARTNKQIAIDLVECMKGFLKKLPKFSNVPTYILTESYGGKMGAEFALVWYKEQQAGTIKSNLKGVGLGDAWISPIDSVMTWAPFLLSTGMIDSNGYKKIQISANATKDAVDNGRWSMATTLWSYTENVIVKVTDNIDFYNILTKLSPAYERSRTLGLSSIYTVGDAKYHNLIQKDSRSLEDLMNGPVKTALGLKTFHGRQSNMVFNMLMEDFMKPVVDKVELLLNETNINVFVYTGHMDLIVDTPGTVLWVDKINWKNAYDWSNAKRLSLVSDRIIEGYSKRYGNFGFYWVNRAGHMVPKDNPAAMAQILKDLTTNAYTK